MVNGQTLVVWANKDGGYLIATFNDGVVILRKRVATYSDEEKMRIPTDAIEALVLDLIGKELFFRNERGQIQKLLRAMK